MLRGLVAIALLTAVAAGPAAAAPRNGPIFFTTENGLAKVRPDGTHRHVVSRDFEAYGFDLSRDGRTFVTVYNGALRLRAASDLAVVRDIGIDGSWIGNPSWAPGGRQISYQACEREIFTDIDECVDYGIYRVAVDGSNATRVVAGQEASWSPDGRSMVFLTTLEQGPNGYRCHGLAVVRTSGRGLRRIFPRHGGCGHSYVEPHSASFSPSGRRVVLVHDDSVWTVRPDGSHARRVMRARSGHVPQDARFSPDGRAIAYSVQRRDGTSAAVYVIGVRGGAGRRLAQMRYGGRLAWQPLPSAG